MQRSISAATFVVQSFRPLLELDRLYCDEIGRTIPIPTFESDVLSQLCEGAMSIFDHADIVLHLHPPLYIVGDIHGNIFDLIRVFIHAGPPPRSHFLFLGDYVDRGEYSIEVLALLFALLISYPEHIFLLRGNHEFESMNSVYGFSFEVTSLYQSSGLFEEFNAVFQWMPLVAILDDQIFCVHGGVAPHAKTIAQLKKIKRPLPSYDVDLVTDLVWSDPCADCRTFDESARGLGVQFGVKTLHDFLTTLNMRMMIRGHQCVQSGIGKFGGDLLYTVFSCSEYEGQENRCGLVFVDAELEIELFSLPPMQQIPRDLAGVKKVTRDGAAHELQAEDSLTLNPKLFDGGQAKFVISRGAGGRKENLLQKFTRMGTGGAARIAFPRAVSPDMVKLPPLVDTQQSLVDL
jgi:protein phosphatase